MDPSVDLLQISLEEIAKHLGIEDYIPVGHAGVSISQPTGHMTTTQNVGITTLQPSYAQAVSKMVRADATQPLFPEKVASQLEEYIPVRYPGVATLQSTGLMKPVEDAGIATLQPSSVQAVSTKRKTDPTQPRSAEKVTNQLDFIQVGIGGVLTSQTADQMNVANRKAATTLRSVKNLGTVTSPSEKPYITQSAQDPPTSSIRSLEIGTSQHEDDINAKNHGEPATSESKGASLERNQEMQKYRNRKENKKIGGGQVSSTLTAQKKIEKQLEGHNISIGNVGFANSQPAGRMNVENLRVATLQSEGHVTEENAEITTSEKPGIIESKVETSPSNSLMRNLENGILSENIYWAIANLEDERNAENQGHAKSEPKDELVLLEIKPKRKNPKNYKKKKQKIGNREGSTGVNVPSNRCCSKGNIALLTILVCILHVVGGVCERSSSGASRFSLANLNGH